MKCKININDDIEIELTEHGKMLYCEVYGEKGREYGNLLRMQLWVFMNVFGDSFYNGAQQIVVNNEIVVVDEQ